MNPDEITQRGDRGGWTQDVDPPPPCPLHPDEHGDVCGVCRLTRKGFVYDLLAKSGADPGRFARHATSAEKGSAQFIVSALELWTGNRLAYLADLAPQQVMHACQVCEWSYPGVDGGMVPVLLLHLAAKELKKVRAELATLKDSLLVDAQ